MLNENKVSLFKELIRAVLAALLGLLGGVTAGCAFVPVI